MDEYLSYPEAAELMGTSVPKLQAWLSKHHVPRYVRRQDLMLIRASTPGPGARQDLCVDGKSHDWDQDTREEDRMTGDPLVWCGRRGCGVGVVLHPGDKWSYRHRPV